MKSYALSSSKLLRPSRHVILFTAWDQPHKWRDMLKNVTYLDEFGTKQYPFVVYDKLLQLIRSLVTNMKNPGRRTFKLFQSTKYGLHVVRNGAPFAKQHCMLIYEEFNYVSTRYPGFHLLLYQVPPMTNGELLLLKAEKSEETFTKRSLRPVQNRRTKMKKLVRRFSQERVVILPPFVGTFSTVMACMELL